MLKIAGAVCEEQPIPGGAVVALLAVGVVVGVFVCQRRLRAAKNAAEFPASTARWWIVAGLAGLCALVYLLGGGAR